MRGPARLRHARDRPGFAARQGAAGRRGRRAALGRAWRGCGRGCCHAAKDSAPLQPPRPPAGAQLRRSAQEPGRPLAVQLLSRQRLRNKVRKRKDSDLPQSAPPQLPLHPRGPPRFYSHAPARPQTRPSRGRRHRGRLPRTGVETVCSAWLLSTTAEGAAAGRQPPRPGRSPTLQPATVIRLSIGALPAAPMAGGARAWRSAHRASLAVTRRAATPETARRGERESAERAVRRCWRERHRRLAADARSSAFGGQKRVEVGRHAQAPIDAAKRRVASCPTGARARPGAMCDHGASSTCALHASSQQIEANARPLDRDCSRKNGKRRLNACHGHAIGFLSPTARRVGCRWRCRRRLGGAGAARRPPQRRCTAAATRDAPPAHGNGNASARHDDVCQSHVFPTTHAR